MTRPTHLDPAVEATVERVLAQLDVSEKVALLTGGDFWSTVAIDRVGLGSMLLSDGPSGVRGGAWDERHSSLALPCGSALGASWNFNHARAVGQVVASEALEKGVHVVLGPTINLQRSPLGGRNFECLSEDPHLTGQLASGYVAGVQEHGVAATPKHYVANDSETDRFTIDVHLDDQPLHELYLAPFEKTVVDAAAWALMSAYNQVNGTTCSENPLLTTPLRTDWGFDGVVVSDWGAVRTLAAAHADQDLVMPGPTGPWGHALHDALIHHQIDPAVIDAKVRRILRLACRVGALQPHRPPSAGILPPASRREFARTAATEGMVLLRNNGILPLPATSRVAVIGQHAVRPRIGGGGSSAVIPERVVTPLDALRDSLPHDQVTFALGFIAQEGIVDLPLTETRNPRTGEHGVHLSYLADNGTVLLDEERRATSFAWFGSDAPTLTTKTLTLDTHWTPAEPVHARLGFSTVGRARIWIDDTLVLDAEAPKDGDDLGAAVLSPSTRTTPTHLDADRTYQIHVEYECVTSTQMPGAMAFALGLEPLVTDRQQFIDEAVALAADAETVILTLGTTEHTESEGSDRTHLRLPDDQIELAGHVLAANQRTIVVINAGAPVELPFADQAAAILVTWFAGQEIGAALADILLGRHEPGGRLPMTWPDALAHAPVTTVAPTEGTLTYTEGIHVGHRAWIRTGRTPAWWFGHGLGYTTWRVDNPRLSGDAVHADLTNTGDRAGKHVLQVYASRAASIHERPDSWLVGFSTTRLEAGAQQTVTVNLDPRAFDVWTSDGWALEPGPFTLTLNTSADPDSATYRLEYLPARRSTPKGTPYTH